MFLDEREYEVVLRLRKELNGLLDKERRMLCQRSKIEWLEGGDGNTSYFHGKAT